MRHTSIYFLLSIFIFSSCEKVIDLPLNIAPKKYVIEGTITDSKGGCRVLISQTKNFDEDNNFKGISGAGVTIADEDGNILTLPEASPGIYTDSAVTGAPGKTYTMQVSINGTSFSASSVMPAKVAMDSLYITDDNIFGQVRKTPNINYTDPKGRGNNYRFVLYVNGAKRNNIYIVNDDYSDGNFSSIKLFLFGGDDDKKIKSGDKIGVYMLCISPEVYKYWYSLNAGATGGNNAASPANPVSNISGGALGYFSAQTAQTKYIDVP